MTDKNESPDKHEFEHIKTQIDALIDDVVTDERLRNSRIKVDEEPIAVYALPAVDYGSAAQRGKDLGELAKPTGHWHYQIRFNGKSLAYARSALLNNDRASLSKVSVSSLAAAIDVVLRNVHNRLWVRLLTVPERHVNALWWTDEAGKSQVRVLPGRFTKPESTLETLDSRDFLNFLNEKPRLDGIKPKPD
jgi:hypothetical protein